MEILSAAIGADIAEDYLNAISLYEESLEKEGVNIEVITNLAVLCFSITEPGSDCRLSHELFLRLSYRDQEVLNEGLIVYPNSLELNFWKKYLSSQTTGDSFEEQDVLELISQYENDSLVPYFIAYMVSPSKYLAQRNQLFSACRKHLTAKNTYILAYLENDIAYRTNKSSTIGDLEFTGFALDDMQRIDLTPSDVENIIQKGSKIREGIATTAYYDSDIKITVIIDTSSGRVIKVKFCRWER